jgi:hypothetical protein
MAFVLTVDQIESRRDHDRVADAIAELSGLPTVLAFTRTVGDEFQGLLADPVSVVDAILSLMRSQLWHVGLGIGAVEEPLPADARSARGEAFLCARNAVERAKDEPSHLVVVAARQVDHEATDAEAGLRLLASVRTRRTDQGWEAVDLVGQGHSRGEVAGMLDISRQAVSQRLLTAQWSLEEAARPTLARLLARADRAASG